MIAAMHLSMKQKTIYRFIFCCFFVSYCIQDKENVKILKKKPKNIHSYSSFHYNFPLFPSSLTKIKLPQFVTSQIEYMHLEIDTNIFELNCQKIPNDNYIMSLSNSESQKNIVGPQAFIDRPLIIISSSESEQEKELSVQEQVGNYQSGYLKVVEHKVQSEAERKRKKQEILLLYEQNKRKHQLEKEEDQKINGHLKISASAYKARVAKQQQLKKEFPSYKHLPPDKLAFVKQKMEQFDQHPKCQIQKDSTQNQSTRQNYRKKLTKFILLAIQQLKISKSPKSQAYNGLITQQYDILEYSYKVASEIQITFYKKLYKKKLANSLSKKPGQVYHKQIDIVLKELTDKNNVKFRRNIIIRNYPLNQLAEATQESLVCQKTKKEELQKQRILIRQNQKIDPNEGMQVEQENFQPPHLRSCESIRSHSEIEEKKETAEQKQIRQRLQSMNKTKQIFKKTYTSIMQSMREMSQRIQKLRKTGFELAYLNIGVDY